MHIAILTFQGFNELDSMVALGILNRIKTLGSVPACTDLTTKPWVQQAGVNVLNQAFFAAGNVARAMRHISPYLPSNM
jgi:hypothetical protein